VTSGEEKFATKIGLWSQRIVKELRYSLLCDFVV